MNDTALPDAMRRRVQALEKRLGRPIILRAARWPDAGLRGRVSRRHGALLVEYRDDVAGFFWHLDIIDELLTCIENGQLEVTLRDAERSTIADTPRHGLDEDA